MATSRNSTTGPLGQRRPTGHADLITPAKQAAAKDLIPQRLGGVAGAGHSAPSGVHVPCHLSVERERVDIVLDRFDMVYHGFWITHVDALCHVAWDGELYNGRPFADSLTAEGATWCPIDPIFNKGIITRGVLLDIAAGRNEGHITVGHPVTPKELDAAARRAGVQVEPGDVVVGARRRRDVSYHPSGLAAANLAAPGAEFVVPEWFREKDIAAIAWDMMDERPSGYEGFGMGTHLAIPFLGLALIDNIDPERLAVACAEQGRYEFFFNAVPLPLVGATGAPAHPIAISEAAVGCHRAYAIWRSLTPTPTCARRNLPTTWTRWWPGRRTGRTGGTLRERDGSGG